MAALTISYHYLRDKFVDLLVLLVVQMVSSAVLMFSPLGGLVSWALGPVFNMALIDNYLNYKKKMVSLTSL